MKKRIIGLILLSMGVGMLLAFMVPAWSFLVAAVLVIVGFWNLFLS